MKFLTSILRYAPGVAGLSILSALLFALMAAPGSAHETPNYADDDYSLGALQAVTQQLCHGTHATVIQSLTAPSPGVYRLSQGRLSGIYNPTIVTAPWTGQLDGDILTWSPTERDSRIVVMWEGEGCLFRMPVMELLPSTTLLPMLQR